MVEMIAVGDAERRELSAGTGFGAPEIKARLAEDLNFSRAHNDLKRFHMGLQRQTVMRSLGTETVVTRSTANFVAMTASRVRNLDDQRRVVGVEGVFSAEENGS